MAPKTVAEGSYEYFYTDETMKSIAKRLQVSPSTLRGWWQEKFGPIASAERRARLQKLGAVRYGARRKGITYPSQLTTLQCEACGASVGLNALQKAKRKRPVLCTLCEEKDRGVDRHCPVCGFGCVGSRGLGSHLHKPKVGDPAAHREYLQTVKERRWEGCAEGADYVVCLECGGKFASLHSHLARAHGVSAADYTIKHPTGKAWSDATLKRKTDASVEASRQNSGKGKRKRIRCPSCDQEHEVSAHLAYVAHDCRCFGCIESERKDRLLQLTENLDYVTCQVCGHTAENLTSHIRSSHPDLVGKYRKAYPNALITAGNSVACANPVGVGSIFPPVRNVGRALNLHPEDFAPFLEPDGTVDRCRMSQQTGICQATLRSYMRMYGLHTSPKYVLRRIEAPSRKRVRQASCAEFVAVLLGEVPYKQEWTSPDYVNPVTRWRFKFDAYYPDYELLLEFNGYQHWTFPSVYIKERAKFDALLERDCQKAAQVEALGKHKLLVVRDDEPWRGAVYMGGRLRELGIDVVT